MCAKTSCLMCSPQSLALSLSEPEGQLILPFQSSECSSIEQDLSARSLGCGQQKPTWVHSSKERISPRICYKASIMRPETAI